MARICIALTLVAWTGLLHIVSGHSEDTDELAELAKEVENIEFDVNDMKPSLQNVYEVIRTKIDDVTRQNEDEKRKVKQAKINQERIKNIQTRLDNVVHLLEKVGLFINAEDEADATLEKLPLQTMQKLEDNKSLIKENIDAVKLHVQTKFDHTNLYLTEVDEAAKSRNVFVSGVQYYGSVGSACSAGKDVCNLPDTECRGGKCQCLPGLSFDSLHRECVKECSHYGDNFQSVPNYIIRDFNNLIRNDSSLADCKKHCMEETTFECRSFDFFPRWSTCYFSEETKNSVPAESWEYNSAGSHYQRGCSE